MLKHLYFHSDYENMERDRLNRNFDYISTNDELIKYTKILYLTLEGKTQNIESDTEKDSIIVDLVRRFYGNGSNHAETIKLLQSLNAKISNINFNTPYGNDGTIKRIYFNEKEVFYVRLQQLDTIIYSFVESSTIYNILCCFWDPDDEDTMTEKYANEQKLATEKIFSSINIC
jgi:hypothetical protein